MSLVIDLGLPPAAVSPSEVTSLEITLVDEDGGTALPPQDGGPLIDRLCATYSIQSYAIDASGARTAMGPPIETESTENGEDTVLAGNARGWLGCISTLAAPAPDWSFAITPTAFSDCGSGQPIGATASPATTNVDFNCAAWTGESATIFSPATSRLSRPLANSSAGLAAWFRTELISRRLAPGAEHLGGPGQLRGNNAGAVSYPAVANQQASSSSSAGADGEQSFTPADLRAGVKLQAGGSLKISVRGISGKPRSGGRVPRSVPTVEARGTDGADSGARDHSGAAGTNDRGPANATAESGTGWVELTVVDAENRPMAGATVEVFHGDGQVAKKIAPQSGAVRFDELVEADRYIVNVNGRPIVLAGGASNPSAESATGWVELAVIDSKNRPMSGATVEVFHGGGKVAKKIAPQSGALRFDGLTKASRYAVRVNGQSIVLASGVNG